MSDTFIRDISRRYAGGRERLFVLHGNTGDLFPHMETRFTLPDYLYHAFTAGGGDDGARIWIHYSLDRGVRWINDAKATGAARLGKLLGSEGQTKVTFTKNPLDLIRMLMEVCTRREKKSTDSEGRIVPLRVVISDAHLIVPDAPTHFMRPDDRELLVSLKRFASEPFYDDTNTLIVLATDAVSGIHRELREVSVT
ncbi:MAG: hypothetical protein Q7S02_00365, partial [bacterium]|nr:hypothetical protein [bacterium]